MSPAHSKGAVSAALAVFAQRKCIASIGDGMRGVAAVAGVSREERPVAQILLAARAIRTRPAGMAKPGDAHAFAQAEFVHAGPERIDMADDLVTGNDRKLRMGKSPSTTCIGPADAARHHANPYFADIRLRSGRSRIDERFTRTIEHHRAHETRRFGTPSGSPHSASPADPLNTRKQRQARSRQAEFWF